MRIFTMFGAILLLSACAVEDDRSGARSVSVVAQTAEFLADEQTVEAIGTARAVRSAQIYPEVSGQVVAVRFQPGSFVRAGAVLVELDSRQERLALELAEIRVDEARQLLDRYRRIEDTGAISDSQIAEGETTLAAAEIERDQAQLALSRRTISAPFSGHVSFSEVDPGDRVTLDTLIAQIDQRGRLFVDFNAPEAVFRRLRPGETVEVEAFSEPGVKLAAQIGAVDSAIEQEQRSYRVRTEIANEDDRFRPGMSFSVRFIDSGEVRPSVPEAAVVWTGEGSAIFAVRDGKAVRVPVTITSRRSGIALLDANIERDSLVIVEGVQKVREGQAVSLVDRVVRDATEVEVSGA